LNAAVFFVRLGVLRFLQSALAFGEPGGELAAGPRWVEI
jgi:hypothetical protein